MDELVPRVNELQPVVLLRLRNMTALDTTGLRSIENLAEALHASGRAMILCGARQQPRELMEDEAFQAHVGKENICANVTEALERAKRVYPSVAGVEVKRQWKRRASDREAAAANTSIS